MSVKVGVLAIQGAYAKHSDMLKSLGADVRLVKSSADFESIDKLVIPGGESTTLLNVLAKHSLFDKLRDFCSKKPVFGTCAGSIILSKGPSYLGLIDLTVERNAYGRQLDSFITNLEFDGGSISGMFIRAPRFVSIGDNVDVLSSYNHSPVLVRQGNVLVSSFHPELTNDASIHQYFLNM
ncbi:pyridoxal 5'-phosphate synthase glutaminase subunit PdxT [Francisella sp. 19X1-34]|uniref:pyridoxal 5'-phosphate synthase glutaminase subunit PdxT n=1 Tax=Francisella sp. 19X1-34 TaxID=3087177 RepID=UPI002E32FCF1|nr:pyridoxal 5'-phosphate synthase glutaminase subunit PdxT [Francisella sp. 19X1-34]MED7787960.1 pyridoxal 5'-phosphate synthase glutaminase subunit PdxT [Francisella sp. 19X1-34]